VDAEAEYLIQQALDEVLKGRTALVIAHRLSTIRNADKIIALEGGRICEVGDHELLSRGGLYRWQNGVALLLQDYCETYFRALTAQSAPRGRVPGWHQMAYEVYMAAVTVVVAAIAAVSSW